MSDSIIVAIISAVVTIITVFVSAKTTRDKMSQEMHEQITLLKNDMDHMSAKIEEHNGYAKMFQENIPAIKQHMSDIDRRLNNLEAK